MTICNSAACNKLAIESYCPEHKAKHEERLRELKLARGKEHDKRRGSANSRGYGYAWRKARDVYILSNPLCVRCREQNKITMANVVDHVTPHGGDKRLFWDRDNWQSLCKSCHDRKTAVEDGGFRGAK